MRYPEHSSVLQKPLAISEVLWVSSEALSAVDRKWYVYDVEGFYLPCFFY